MPHPSDLTRLEQTIAELMARIATLQDAQERASAFGKTTHVLHREVPGGAEAAHRPPSPAHEDLRSDVQQVTALRNALKDLGARMAVLTMHQEGVGSPIPDLVRGAGETSAAPNAHTGNPSIAQRIHALLAKAEAEAEAPPAAV